MSTPNERVRRLKNLLDTLKSGNAQKKVSGQWSVVRAGQRAADKERFNSVNESN